VNYIEPEDLEAMVEKSLGEQIVVFVYGTLKEGYGNHRYHLGDGRGTFLGYGVTKKKFRMLDGGFPVVINYETDIPEGRVQGEVYGVYADTMADLDALEGYPDMYTRSEEQIEMQDGSVITAWIYTGSEDFWGRGRRAPVTLNSLGFLQWGVDHRNVA
jgi:gamma-glutamylcyclotransferase (GGCT)/AIG2-like uncharacterized protein YtfP